MKRTAVRAMLSTGRRKHRRAEARTICLADGVPAVEAYERLFGELESGGHEAAEASVPEKKRPRMEQVASKNRDPTARWDARR